MDLKFGYRSIRDIARAAINYLKKPKRKLADHPYSKNPPDDEKNWTKIFYTLLGDSLLGCKNVKNWEWPRMVLGMYTWWT